VVLVGAGYVVVNGGWHVVELCRALRDRKVVSGGCFFAMSVIM